MNAAAPSIREKLLRALEEYDSQTRNTRAERIEWLSLHSPTLPAVMGRTETLHLLEEARQSFIGGHFIAALLTAMACIEHCIVEELTLLGLIQQSPKFSKAIEVATKSKVFPPDWLERAKRLSLRRNPFAHLKEEDHHHALGTRIREERRHPYAIIEADAKDAVDLMYNFFVATLREATFD
jgi:hypothetical protein